MQSPFESVTLVLLPIIDHDYVFLMLSVNRSVATVLQGLNLTPRHEREKMLHGAPYFLRLLPEHEQLPAVLRAVWQTRQFHGFLKSAAIFPARILRLKPGPVPIEDH
jgi:hypothetical protein